MALRTDMKSSGTSTSWMPLPGGVLLQRKCACGGSSGMTGSCPECETNKLLGKPLQTKLAISEPGDVYEQEADRVSEQVMRMPEPVLEGNARESSTMPLIQRKVSSTGSGIDTVPPIVHEVLNSSGQPLDAATRAFFEPRFDHDFSRVRIHTGPSASASADAVNAHAYTVGDHIAFGGSQFAPASHSGRRLLAHELAHTIQQTGSATRTLARQPKSGTPTGEEFEVLEKPATPKSKDDAPWFVWEDKGREKWELPKGTRVESKGKPLSDMRNGERVFLRTVRVLSLPDKVVDERKVVGKTGAVPERFLSKVVPKPESEAKIVWSASRFITAEVSDSTGCAGQVNARGESVTEGVGTSYSKNCSTRHCANKPLSLIFRFGMDADGLPRPKPFENPRTALKISFFDKAGKHQPVFNGENEATYIAPGHPLRTSLGTPGKGGSTIPFVPPMPGDLVVFMTLVDGSSGEVVFYSDVIPIVDCSKPTHRQPRKTQAPK